MYPTPLNETLIKTKTYRDCSESFAITDKDTEFFEKISPLFKESAKGNEAGNLVSEQNPRSPSSVSTLQMRFTIPTPTLCPDCRQQRGLSFRNERKLYKRKFDSTGKDYEVKFRDWTCKFYS